MESINGIRKWLMRESKLSANENIKTRRKKGYRVLFDGPASSDKMETAKMIGREFSKDVHRVDLSQIVSKYIGETEKNLRVVFEKAEGKNWILFFDEADSLFGNRTEVNDAHDRFANRKTRHILKAEEDYPDIVIFATNRKGNIDAPFIRRFQTIVHFQKT